MFKFPLVIIYAVIAFNITGFAFLLQMDWLIFNAPIYKVIAWALTIGAWVLVYRNRHKYYEIRLK